MVEKRASLPPRWFVAVVASGAFVACGIYLGMMRVEGFSADEAIRAGAFGVLGLLMLWGVLGRR